MSKVRLRTANSVEVRRTLSRVINMVANEEIDPKTANAIIVGCNAVLGAIRVDEQKKKLEELEMMVEELSKKDRNG